MIVLVSVILVLLCLIPNSSNFNSLNTSTFPFDKHLIHNDQCLGCPMVQTGNFDHELAVTTALCKLTLVTDDNPSCSELNPTKKHIIWVEPEMKLDTN